MKKNTVRVRLLKILIVCLCSSFIGNATMPIEKKVIKNSQKADPGPVQKVITQFLQWYKINLTKANSFQLLKKDSNDYFMVDKKAVKEYLNFMKSSKYLALQYIAFLQAYFDDQAMQLQKDKIQSDVPEGFDYDVVLVTQEPDLVLNQINKIKFKRLSINNSVALIGLKWPSKNDMVYEFEMYKNKQGWQIGYISTPNFD